MKALSSITLAILLVLPSSLYATDGDLDLTFGIGGRVTTSNSSGSTSANASAIQADGKIIAAGSVRRGSTDFFLVRCNPDGSMDKTFGVDGIVSTDFSGFTDIAVDLVIQSDGKIVAAGRGGLADGFDFALTRYNENGSLDPSFGINGKVITDLPGFAASVSALTIQSDGKIVAAGVSFADRLPTRGKSALVRYNVNGSLDTTFGIDGLVITEMPGVLDAGDLAIQSDGKILAAGVACVTDYGQPTCYGSVVRFNKDGSLDPTFGIGGKATTEVLGTSDIRDLALQSDGKIIAAGGSRYPGPGYFIDFGMVRFNADGLLDTSFGAGGAVKTDFGFWNESINALLLQPDGKIVAGGATEPEDYNRSAFALARYNRDGSLDTNFGIDGKVRLEPPDRFAYLRSLAMQRDGKIVAVGTEYYDYFSTFALARYNTTGLLIVSEVNVDQTTVAIGSSWTASLSGLNLTDQTWFDVRFRSPGEETDQIALNWQRGTSERHVVPAGTAQGTWTITGIRAHENAGDHSGEFVPVSAIVTVSAF